MVRVIKFKPELKREKKGKEIIVSVGDKMKTKIKACSVMDGVYAEFAEAEADKDKSVLEALIILRGFYLKKDENFKAPEGNKGSSAKAAKEAADKKAADKK